MILCSVYLTYDSDSRMYIPLTTRVPVCIWQWIIQSCRTPSWIHVPILPTQCLRNFSRISVAWSRMSGAAQSIFFRPSFHFCAYSFHLSQESTNNLLQNVKCYAIAEECAIIAHSIVSEKRECVTRWMQYLQNVSHQFLNKKECQKKNFFSENDFFL